MHRRQLTDVVIDASQATPDVLAAEEAVGEARTSIDDRRRRPDPAPEKQGGCCVRDTILITGGAGFIGSHLADALLEQGHRVRALDNLTPQVHGDAARPAYLHEDVDLRVGDVRDPEAVRAALDGVDAVVHLAARVGVGQSMYEIAAYTSENSGGTAVLLEALLDRPVRRLVVASSMSIY